MGEIDFGDNFNFERKLIDALLLLLVAAFVAGFGVLLFSGGSLAWLSLLLAVLAICSAAIILWIARKRYAAMPVVKEKRGLLVQIQAEESQIHAATARIERAHAKAKEIDTRREADKSKRQEVYAHQTLQLKNRRAQLEADEKKELATALQQMQAAYLASGLRNSRLEVATIPGIGPKMKERLRQNGIVAASDISYSRVSQIQGIGEAKAEQLSAWRKNIEATLNAGKPTRLPERLEDDIQKKYSAQLDAIRAEEQRAKEAANAELTAIEQLASQKQHENDAAQATAHEDLNLHRGARRKLEQNLVPYGDITFKAYASRALKASIPLPGVLARDHRGQPHPRHRAVPGDPHHAGSRLSRHPHPQFYSNADRDSHDDAYSHPYGHGDGDAYRNQHFHADDYADPHEHLYPDDHFHAHQDVYEHAPAHEHEAPDSNQRAVRAGYHVRRAYVIVRGRI